VLFTINEEPKTMSDNGIFERQFHRRRFIKLGAGTIAAGVAFATTTAYSKASIAGPTAIGAKGRKPIIIDALEAMSNMNLRIQQSKQSGSPEDRDKNVDARTLNDVRASGMSAANVTTGFVAGDKEPFEHRVREVGQWDALIRRKSNNLVKVLGAQDIRDAHATGKTGVILGFQNAAMMGEDASRVEIFANLGVRVIQLTYNVRNQLNLVAMSWHS
jgi:membrane dipeptidase